MKFVELESERLMYRRFTLEDCPVVFDYLGNAENMKYRSEPKSEADSLDTIRWAISNAEKEECSIFVYAVVLKANDKLIGEAVLFDLGDKSEIGWTIHRDYWRKGYGTEIAKALLLLGFDMLGLRRIISECNAKNHGSHRIMEKIGMRQEARFVKACQGTAALDREWCDVLHYAILAEEYFIEK